MAVFFLSFLSPWKAVGGDGRGSFGIATDAVLGSRCTSKLHTGDAKRSETSQPAKWEWQKRMMTLGTGKGNWWKIEISLIEWYISLEDVQKQARQPNFILFNNLMSRLLHFWVWHFGLHQEPLTRKCKATPNKSPNQDGNLGVKKTDEGNLPLLYWMWRCWSRRSHMPMALGDLPIKALGSTCTWNLKPEEFPEICGVWFLQRRTSFDYFSGLRRFDGEIHPKTFVIQFILPMLHECFCGKKIVMAATRETIL